MRWTRALLGQLVRNLVADAVAYDVPGATEVRVDGGAVTVENTGPVVAPGDGPPGLFETVPARLGARPDGAGGRARAVDRPVDRGGPGEGEGEREVGGLVVTVTVTLPVTVTTGRRAGQASQVESSPR
ncbi:hypothetical protein ACFUJR_15690 [Streptomyces sp. NPDC057271]|uniref:hypothetical protein n=1 Tax=unclassified Streptomyces TaxID=2593676 RepID=UPI00364332BF